MGNNRRVGAGMRCAPLFSFLSPSPSPRRAPIAIVESRRPIRSVRFRRSTETLAIFVVLRAGRACCFWRVSGAPSACSMPPIASSLNSTHRSTESGWRSAQLPAESSERPSTAICRRRPDGTIRPKRRLLRPIRPRASIERASDFCSSSAAIRDYRYRRAIVKFDDLNSFFSPFLPAAIPFADQRAALAFLDVCRCDRLGFQAVQCHTYLGETRTSTACLRYSYKILQQKTCGRNVHLRFAPFSSMTHPFLASPLASC